MNNKNMNKNNLNRNNIENDDMNIKSHLDTSLDLSGISVSEDLINRTLEAIRQQPADNTGREDSSNDIVKKVIPWNRYIRGFAGVAAATLIVFVGFNVINNLGLGSKKDSYSADDNTNGIMTDQSTDEIVKFAATAEQETAADDTAVTTEENASIYGIESSEYSITAAVGINRDAKVQYNANDEGATGTTDARLAGAYDADGAATVSFQDICLLAPEEVEYVTITDIVNNTAISLTDQIEIINFYSMMNNHQFSYGQGTSADQYYSVEIKSPKPEEALYTIWIGENITVQATIGDNTSESMYTSLDYEVLKKDLDVFFQEYSK